MDNFHDVFISYGRPDSQAFVIQLSQRLAVAKLKVWVDLNSIPLGVDYQQQINRDLERADNFLFVISPHAINSPHCAIELDQALRCHKRIIPLLHVKTIDRDTWQQRHPQGTDADWQAFVAAGRQSSLVNMHPALRKINWVMALGQDNPSEAVVNDVLELIQRQRSYVRQHTLWLVKALEWHHRQKQSQFLLVGEARQQAEAWLKTRFADQQAPCIPTDLQCSFITESSKNADNLMTQVFLAYAEEDKSVMEQVQRFLCRQGITVWINTTSLPTGEDFLASIDRGIEATDNLVYLLSPASVNSVYCQHELNYALALNKRVIPILVSPMAGCQLPTGLQELHYINLSEASGQNKGLDHTELLKILYQDKTYHRQHKWLLTQALKWQRQNQNPSILLRGYNLRRSEAWLKVAQTRQQQPPTPLQVAFIQESVRQPESPYLDVFISYSRTDSEFARRLNDALQIQGKTTWFDQESIDVGANFQREIYRGIASSHSFVFVISPSSVNSPYCADEVTYAAGLNKRLVTVLHRPVAAETLPVPLTTVQWIDFRRHQDDFYGHFSELVRTLDMDREHVQHHTKLTQRAMEWAAQGKDTDLLLRGSEFAIAQTWLQTARQDQKQPPPTDLQRDFLATSQARLAAEARQENRRQVILRSLLGLISLAFLAAAGLGLWAFSLWRQSEIAQLQALVRTSNALFLAEQKPEALVTALKAGQNLERTAEANQALVLSMLQQAIYGIRELRQITNHGDRVNDVAYVPDGEIFISVSDDSTVTLFRQDGTLIQVLNDHQERVQRVSVSPDGQRFATASADGIINIWARDGLLLQTLTEHQGAVTGLHFNPNPDEVADGTTLALVSAGADGIINLWTPDGQLIRTFEDPSGGVNQVAFSPGHGNFLHDNRLTLATAGADGNLRLFSLDGELLQTFRGHRDVVNDVAFSPDGEVLASASRDRTAKLWHRNGQEQHALIGHDNEVNAIKFAPDGQTLVTAGEDSNVRLWNRAGQDVQSLSGHLAGVRGIAFAPENDILVTASADNSLKLWDLAEEPLQTLKGHRDWVLSVAYSPDGSIIATASGDRTVRLWNPQGKLLATLEGHTGWINTVAFSPDGQYLATASDDQTARLWSLDGETLVIFQGHQDQVSDLAFSPTHTGFSPGQSPFLATSSADQTIKLWAQDGTLLNTLVGHHSWVRSVTFSPDGDTIASTDADHALTLWSRDGVLLQSFLNHDDWVREVTFSPDGQTLATASADNTAKLWDRNGNVLATLMGHNYWVVGVAFSPDGETIATASADNTIKLWNRQGEEQQTLFGHRNWVVDLAFSPDGQTLASASGDQTVILWDLPAFTLEALLERGCRWLMGFGGDDRNPEMADVLRTCQQGADPEP